MGFYRTNADKERINSFAEAEARYNDVKPVISKNHTKGDDIRPVGDRRRKWERIVKVSDTCYELTVTDYYHDNTPLIRWEDIDGYYEQVTFWNNGRVSGYTMLENLCPIDLVFFVEGSTGRQYVGIAGGDKCFAPKDMQKPITFKRLRSGDLLASWKQVGTRYTFKHAMTRVNKQIKEAVKPLTDKFYKWVITTYPMLPLSDYQYRYKMQREFEEYYANLGAAIENDRYFELMMRNAWHISGGVGQAENTTCLRVLVTHSDGMQTVEEIEDDLGMPRTDMNAIRRFLTDVKGFKVAKVSLCGP